MSGEGRLQFGTAGIRGPMGPGPDEINLRSITRVAAGVAAYLGTGSVVIGYDGRRESDTFAHLIAEVMTAHGLQARLLPRALPTPVLAASVRTLSCAAGLMVTASHNPANDNGVKVYLADGFQIIPPVDRQIADLIASIDPDALPSATASWIIETEDVVQSYVQRVAGLCEPGARDLRITHTALHGVGWGVFAQVMAQAGFTQLSTVPAQQDPDPRFPTAPFPNPELPGVLDLLLAQAQAQDADLAIAHDPDADRCAAAVRTAEGSLHVLSGDELGVLLGWWILERMQRGTWPHGTLASSVVSSTLLDRMAEVAGVPSARTLTGFKWIARVSDLAYGYEEALGYCVAPAVAGDKDGISAALILAELCAHLKAQGRTPLDVLDELAARHGRHLTGQRTLHMDPAAVRAAMNHLRSVPPVSLGDHQVEQVIDHDRTTSSLTSSPTPSLPSADLMEISAGDVRAMVRPSGTEPLLKIYAEVVVRGLPSREAQDERAQSLLGSVLDDLVAFVADAPEGHQL